MDTHGHAAETQKLIAYGKVMDDDTKKLAEYSVQENGFIVLMTQKVSGVLCAHYLRKTALPINGDSV